MKHYYSAVFTENEIGYSVRFPDFEGCFTEGDSLEEAYEMAGDALGLYMQNQDGTFTFPKAGKPPQPAAGEFVVLVEFDETAYRKKHSGRAVKKTLTIPSWLNEAAEKKGINFSVTLQDALKEQLHID